MKKGNKKAVFKEYQQDQLILFPPSLSELIAENHPVRVVNAVVDKLDIKLLEADYIGGGTSSYHPRMMLKVLIYSYLNNVYSSRKIESGLKENIHLMWLSAMSYPDHNTINRFRGERLQGGLKEIFRQVVFLLADNGHLSLKEAYTDGTKLESAANRYSFVWGKSVEKNKKKLYAQIEALWDYAQQVAREEMQEEELTDFEQITPEKIDQTVAKIEGVLHQKSEAGEDLDKKKVAKLRYAKKRFADKWQEYEQKQAILGERNSYSKTDPDATFMRLKDDHMKNGQLKPAYNWQITTNQQYILHYSIHQKANDLNTLIPHYEGFREQYGQMPQKAVADAGYGSEENYTYLEEQHIEAFVKFPYFHKEQKKNFKEDISRIENLHYNPEKDCFYCPMGQEMHRISTHKKETTTGFVQTITKYQARNCTDCPLRGVCHKAKGNRIIQVNHQLNNFKAQIRQRLTSQEGIKHRKQRPADVEATFGIIKANHHFKRCLLRGKHKVEIEVGLISLAHNLRKYAYKMAA